MDLPPDVPVVMPAVPRSLVVRRAVLIALALLVAVLCALSGTHAGAYVAAAVVLAAAGAVWSMARRWSDRVEVYADHLLAWETGGPARRIEADDLVEMKLWLRSPIRGFDPGQQVDVTLRPREGAPLVVRGRVGELLPAIRLLGATMARRMTRQLEAGETLYFEDRPRFPTGPLVGAVTLFVMVAAGAFAMFGGSAAASHWLTLLRMVVIVAFIATGVRKGVTRWSQSRRFGGLAVSAHGIRPLSEVEQRAFAASGYRASAGPAEGWARWSELVDDNLDAYGLSVDASSRDEPIVLSANTGNLFPLHALMGEWIARARRARPTGVRVAAVAEEEPVAELEETGDAATSRTAK